MISSGLHQCPRCHATVPVGRQRCVCGYALAAVRLGARSDAPAEALPDDLIQLRLKRARQALAATMAEFMGAPENAGLNQRLEQATREVARLENELMVYKARARKPVPETEMGITTHPDAISATPTKKFSAVQLAKAMQAIRGSSTMARRQKPVAGTSSSVAPADSDLPDKTSSAPTAPVAIPPVSVPPVPLVDAPALVLKPRQEARPTPVSRASAAIEPPLAAAPPRTESVATASGAMPAPTKTCPRCGASVAVVGDFCGCGHDFGARPQSGHDFLSRDEILALRQGTKPS
jgi:hypothetical protein